MKKNSSAANNTAANLGFEAQLWAVAEAVEDDGEPFDGKMQRLVAQLREQQAEAAKLDDAIAANLRELGFGG